jgi:8-oxo-dGTP diphosphatase
MKIVLGIIVRGKEVLIGEVKDEQLSSFNEIKYVFPGGKIDKNETSDKSVEREIGEETGLTVEVKAKIGERIHPSTGKEIEYFHCEYISGSLTTVSELNDDIKKLHWVKITDLRLYMPTLFDKLLDYLHKFE